MPRYLPEPAYRHGSPALTAVLLINLGTPAAPNTQAVRAYLKEFLSDPRVVEIPRPIWWLILNGIILNIRPRRSAEKYASVWTPEGLAAKDSCRTPGQAVARFSRTSRAAGAGRLRDALR
jgi:ferrochelatase